MTGLMSYITVAWRLQTPLAATIWRQAGLSRTLPGKLSWRELDALRRVLCERWPALAGSRVQPAGSKKHDSSSQKNRRAPSVDDLARSILVAHRVWMSV